MKLKLKINNIKLTEKLYDKKQLKKNQIVNIIDKSSKNNTIFLNCYIKKFNNKNVSVSFIKFEKNFKIDYFFNNLNLFIKKKQ